MFDLLGSSLSCDTTGLTLFDKYFCLRIAEPPGRPVLTPEEVRAPSRNNVLPHTTNPAETRFSLEVLAVDALTRHSRRVTIFQLSNRQGCEESGTASRFFSSYRKPGSISLTREANAMKVMPGHGDLRRVLRVPSRRQHRRSTGGNLGGRPKTNQAKERLVLRLREEGCSYRSIREQTGLALSTIRRIIAEQEAVSC